LNPAVAAPGTEGGAGPSAWARWLGIAGLIPFVGLAVALWVSRPSQWPSASAALVGYGAVIISFLGAVHWGLAMRSGRAQPAGQLLWGVAPSLAGWGAMLLGGTTGLLLIAILLWVSFAVDRAVYRHYRLQGWLPLRLRLTLVASLSCLAAFAAMLQISSG
jgi:hypothetical protein